MTLNKISIFTLSILLFSCSGYKGETSITGRVAAFDSHQNIIHVMLDTTWRDIQLKGDKNKSYDGLILDNTTNDFLVVEYSQNKIGRTVKGDIIKFNISGDSIDKVFDSNTGELVGNLCLSKNDNKLLFTLEDDYFNPSDPIGQLNRRLNIFIMDFKKKEIIRKLDTVGLSLNVWINNAPWLNDENRFIYDFRTDREIKMYNDTSRKQITKQAGIYLYDINLDKHSLLIPNGHAGVVSPKEDKIAYLKDNKIYAFNVKTNLSELLYKLNSNESIPSIKWTSNGDFIYFLSFKNYILGYFHSDKIIIRISDKIKMKVIGDNYYNYDYL